MFRYFFKRPLQLVYFNPSKFSLLFSYFFLVLALAPLVSSFPILDPSLSHPKPPVSCPLASFPLYLFLLYFWTPLTFLISTLSILPLFSFRPLPSFPLFSLLHLTLPSLLPFPTLTPSLPFLPFLLLSFLHLTLYQLYSSFSHSHSVSSFFAFSPTPMDHRILSTLSLFQLSPFIPLPSFLSSLHLPSYLPFPTHILFLPFFAFSATPIWTITHKKKNWINCCRFLILFFPLKMTFVWAYI